MTGRTLTENSEDHFQSSDFWFDRRACLQTEALPLPSLSRLPCRPQPIDGKSHGSQSPCTEKYTTVRTNHVTWSCDLLPQRHP